MAKIYCVRCGKDTGYTTDTAVEDKPRSIVPIGSGEEARAHICSSCWEQLSAREILGRG
tara:strand:+ start:140 stop:316 length:177 start_codon:yes stop_codon:yes gene_type:complete